MSVRKKFIGQRKWVRDTLKAFEKLDEGLPSREGQNPQWPEWVDNLWMLVMFLPYPGVKFKNVKNWKAKDLGRFLGRQYAGEYLIEGKVPLSATVIKEGERFSAWTEKRAAQLNPNIDLDDVNRREQQRRKIWRPRFNRFIQETLASACERPYVESAAFFEAFGKAVIIKPDEFLTERTMGLGDKICFTMILMWQEISRLGSVAELHRAFETALKPRGITVKYRRIEKLCQRIKLKFKGPGRPSGTKTQTNSKGG